MFRNMREKTQDALIYVHFVGCADLFTTFTCNPKCNEIICELWFGLNSPCVLAFSGSVF